MYHRRTRPRLRRVGTYSEISGLFTIAQLKLQPEQRTLVRRAISILCHSMEPRLLRTSDPGGTKSFDLVELRLRTLLRLKRRWKKQTRPDELDPEETRAFSEALVDGYVLCQLFNTLYSSPIIRPDARDTVNVAKFRAQCLDCGLPAKDIFLPSDIEDGTAESLTRVAQTVAALVKWVADASARTAIRNALVKYTDNDDVPDSPGADVSIVEIWVDKFIATRLDKPALRFDSESEFAPTSGIHRIGTTGKANKSVAKLVSSPGAETEGLPGKFMQSGIGNLYSPVNRIFLASLLMLPLNLHPGKSSGKSLVLPIVKADADSGAHSLKRALDNLYRFMASLDAISSLVESRQYRLRLLQISAEFKLNPVENKRLRDALSRDDETIAEVLRTAMESDGSRELILGLHGEEAQNCVDLIQDVLDKTSHSDCEGTEDKDHALGDFRHQVHKILVKLLEAQDILPACLFIKGVKRRDSEAFFGGTFGDIYRARFRSEDVALKRVRVFQNTTDRRKIIRGLCREALLWRTLKHPFVLPFRGMDADAFPSLLCLVSPWMKNGTILKHLIENGYADIEKRLFEIAQGLAYLHSQHIIHGDLRGSNILVDDEWHAQLADFGLAVFSDATVGTNSSHNAGSVRWMAPELHHPQSFGLKYFRRTFASDVYSFACVCVELYSGKPPFAEIPHDPAALLQVMAGKRPRKPTCPATLSAGSETGPIMPEYLWELVQMCWSQDRAERPCMTKVISIMQAGNAELIPVVRPSFRSPDHGSNEAAIPGAASDGNVRRRRYIARAFGPSQK
ncbi:hypothetical protein PQX77_001280 [Marasmius sp. AFHP31]|nr:hypothetical protein PQX77_001280 [Marasmius sp. AFHP31]